MKCSNCGLETTDLKPIDMMTGDGIEWFCEECYNEWLGIEEKEEKVIFT